jgi:nicotinate-nucleotide pyrophosphorylase
MKLLFDWYTCGNFKKWLYNDIILLINQLADNHIKIYSSINDIMKVFRTKVSTYRRIEIEEKEDNRLYKVNILFKN